MISRVVGCVWLLASLPGSGVAAFATPHPKTLHGDAVWTGDYALGRDMADLLTAPPDDVLMLKVSWWIGR
jgi:hypothetical protein